MHRSASATRLLVFLVGLLALAVAAGACDGSPASDERLGSAEGAILNGAVDSQAAYAAVGRITRFANPTGSRCTGSLIARRVVLGNAHCFADILTGCATLKSTQSGVMFANTSGPNAGGFDDSASAKSRTIPISKIVAAPGAVTVTTKDCALLCFDGQTLPERAPSIGPGRPSFCSSLPTRPPT